MDPQKNSSAAGENNPVIKSCRRKKKDDATFLEDLKDHIDEFMSASMDEHKSCFQKTVKKMFGMSKVVAERSAATQEVESSLPLRTVDHGITVLSNSADEISGIASEYGWTVVQI